MKCDCFIIIFYGEKTMDLFEYAKSKTLDQESPLASRLRPTTLDEVVGQQHIIGKNTLLYRAIKADKLTSVIFYGPPGTGKTTLAKVIANTTSAEFTQINATVAGKKDMEAVVKEAQQNLGMYGKKTILFIDEIHRFNKGQQDYLLPFVEDDGRLERSHDHCFDGLQIQIPVSLELIHCHVHTELPFLHRFPQVQVLLDIIQAVFHMYSKHQGLLHNNHQQRSAL